MKLKKYNLFGILFLGILILMSASSLVTASDDDKDGVDDGFEDISSKDFITKEKSQKIINLMKKDNLGITKTSLSQELSMHMNTLAKYLSILEKYDVIVKKKIDNKYLYFLSES